MIRWECAGIQCEATHQALLVWRGFSLNPVADKQCPNLSPLLQVPDIADSHHFDGIGYIRHPASGGLSFVCQMGIDHPTSTRSMIEVVIIGRVVIIFVRVPDEHRSTHIAPVIARESGRSAARVGLDPKFGSIVIPFLLPIDPGLHPSLPVSCSYHPLWRCTRIFHHERRRMSGELDR